jgi:hypothetical protein
MLVDRALFVGLVILVSGVSSAAAQGIRTPFQLVPLWSDEMLDHDRMLEIRKEEPLDLDCAGTEQVRGRKLQKYLVDVAEVYDADRHLRLRLAYPKGC